MDYRRIDASRIGELWELQKRYKEEIGEDLPEDPCMDRLRDAMEKGSILFFGAWDGELLAGCCSVTVGFSTFDYSPSGVFEDFYILPEYRHSGVARKLVETANAGSGVSSMTVGCADCDIEMYKALGFTVLLGNLLAL